jgi:exosortase
MTVWTNAAATDASGRMPNLGDKGFFPGLNQWEPRAKIWALALATLMLGVAYAPNLLDLHSIWNGDPNYSHGYLIIPIALVIAWRRLSDTQAEPSPATVVAPWWGWVVLCAVFALRIISYEWNSQWMENVTLLPVIGCLIWTLGGWPLLRRVWPAILFLIFLFPLPTGVNGLIALPLQGIAATGSCFLLQLSGLWAIKEGNVINVTTPHGVMPLDVAVACNGLRMLMTMAATITATVILIPLANWKRLVLLASTVPVAMLSNMIRIFMTGWCYYLFTAPKAKQWSHDVSGYLMMPLALLLVGLELRLLSWLAPDRTEDENDDKKFVLSMLNEIETGKSPRKNADLDELE